MPSPRPVSRIRVSTRQLHGPAVDVSVRGHRYRVDEPATIGGEDSGPTPMEHVVGAIGPCVTVVLDLVAREHGWRVGRVSTAALAEQDRRGLLGEADVPPRFLSIDLEVSAVVQRQETGGPGEPELIALAEEVERRCPAMTLMRDAGVASTLSWTWTREDAA